MNHRVLTLVCLPVLLVTAIVAVAQDSLEMPLQSDIDESTQNLEAIRTQIAARQQALAELADQEHSEEQQLRGIEQEIALIRDLLAGLDEREIIFNAQQDSLQILIEEQAATMDSQREVFARHLRSLYMHGGRRDLEVLFTADSFSSFITRLKFITIMARLDKGLMTSLREDGRRLLEGRRSLRVGLADIWQTREEARIERERLASMDEERRAVLAAVSRRRVAASDAITQLQARERRLADVLTELENRRQHRDPVAVGDDSDFGRQAGRLDWPVSGGQMVRGFGRSVHPEFKTVTMSNGINIAVTAGTPVYAVAAGRVEFADNLPGFEQCVILDHGAGYYTLYANLDKVFVFPGDQVGRTEIVAEVGPGTGDAGAQLYFEVRQGKTPLDPAGWLMPRQ